MEVSGGGDPLTALLCAHMCLQCAANNVCWEEDMLNGVRILKHWILESTF